jgi:tripeptidyl-peptidase-1
MVLGVSWPTPATAYSIGGKPAPRLGSPSPDNPCPQPHEPFLTWLNYILKQDSIPQVISSSADDEEVSPPAGICIAQL